MDVLVIDSVAALTPKAEIEGEMGDKNVGLQARLMSQAMRKLTGAISRTRTCCIFINQTRAQIGNMYGPAQTTTGGNALKFYSTVRMEITPSSMIKDSDDKPIGKVTKVKVVKNKVAPPFQRAEFDIMFGEGISKAGEIIDYGVELGIIKKSGAWFSYDGAKIGQGKEAVRKMIADNPTWDFKQYDWNGDNWIDQVIYIFAGYGGNQGPESYGYVWPNTGSISGINSTHDGMTISNYTNSAELWTDNTSCGIGTICHEYSHSLGLPDIYPTFGDTDFYSVCDEWDLMDGGNFTNMGWCPPNYTAQEKMYLGWLTPEELTEPVTITGMKPISEGGETYIIRHTDKEYLLLENRQWTGWDAGVPGRGLVVTHVDFDESIWRNNAVNTAKGHFRCDIVHADNLHYEEWANLIDSQQWPMYAEAVGMHNRHLSTSPYPWSTDSTTVVNDELSDTSRPAAVMFNVDAEGKKLLSKAVTNIRMTDDGLISFDFMGGTQTHIPSIDWQPRGGGSEVYNIMGQRIATPGKGLFIKNGKKYIKH